MPNLVIYVMPNLETSQNVLKTWEACGVTGVTILESLGLQKMHEIRARKDDLPLFPGLRHLLESEEYHHRTAFTVVDDGFDLKRLIEATQQAIGSDFEAPNSGLLFVLPVTCAYGLRPHWVQKDAS